jgi:hypothetical protein
MRAPAAVAFALALVAVGARDSEAKELKFSSPGRSIYKSNETFGAALDQGMRTFVMEVAMGSGPEGNLGVTLGWLLNRPEGLEFYAGFGVRIAPAWHYTVATRYFLPFLRYRSYVGGGYVLQRLTNLGVRSHSGFGEIGHKWIIRRTYHMTLSLGFQRMISRSIVEGSFLDGPKVDPDYRDEQLDSIHANRYLLCLRLSRAF